MNLSVDLLDPYLESTCDSENDLLKKVKRETFLKETRPNMLSGHYQGRLLSMISKLVSPGSILEIGTFTGYSTLCLAEGLKEEGVIHTIDVNEELEERVRGYFDSSPYADRIINHVGEAVKVIPEISGDFDLVFIDADKKNNWNYFELVINRVPSGGIVLVDNVLWKGKIFNENPDKQTQEILDLNEKLAKDQRVEKLILPVRDGLFVLRKK